MYSASRSLRSSISPFRLRKSSDTLAPPSASRRRTTHSAVSSKPPPKPPSAALISLPESSAPAPSTSSYERPDSVRAKENVTVTVRFRPLSAREIGKGDEIAWYADGDFMVRNEHNSSIAYGFDRVFGPATTTRHVYDVAAQHVVGGAMEGINGTVFAYGVTSSGKTHTMHGEQKSPGIIPLAVKDVFGIIQETPGREFLLRVSYLEIYNEVINDLLDSTGQNLRIREDAQGTYVEGIKEEVVLSPAHALSLIATGEEHRHVGSNNVNLLSSRSHTIFTLTIESSPRGDNEEEVALSQLHLIDLAGSESSKAETTGLRRKEGSYINKSLLTLGTVISKLTDGKATHIPFRDSKLTRLLQSSLSGHGRVSLICTVTPASSNSEETHNTLKFAHRSKHVEIKASQNKILDEKSLIKKYQREISSLKQELQQLKRGMMEHQNMMVPNQDDLLNLKLQFEAGQVKLQSRLEEEEQAKAALMGRIQRLTKLILVSTKNTIPSNVDEKPGHRRRHSFGEDELAYLPDRKRDYMLDDDARSIDSEFSVGVKSDIPNFDELVKDYRRNRRRGMLNWFKLKKPESSSGLSDVVDCEVAASVSPVSSSKSSQKRDGSIDVNDGQRISTSRRGDKSSVVSLAERTQAGDLFTATIKGHRLPPTGTTITDQMDLLREQVKMLAGEVALSISSLKRLSEKASKNPGDLQLRDNIRKSKDDIRDKKRQIRMLEQRMIGSLEMSPHISDSSEISQALSMLATQLNEKNFELEIKSADNRILQEQLQIKTLENAELQEAILLLRHQLDSLVSDCSSTLQPDGNNEVITTDIGSKEPREMRSDWKDQMNPYGETFADVKTPTSVMSLNRSFSQEDSRDCSSDLFPNCQLLMQEVETLKQEKTKLMEEKDGLEIHNKKLSEEAFYAKELASAAAVELRNLAEEVTKLSYQNAKLNADVATAKENTCKSKYCSRSNSINLKQNGGSSYQLEARMRKQDNSLLIEELEKELSGRYQREASLVAALAERDKIEGELRKRLNEAKQREEDLENELANVWVQAAKIRKNSTNSEGTTVGGIHASNVLQTRDTNRFTASNGHAGTFLYEDEAFEKVDWPGNLENLKASYQRERRRCKELEGYLCRLKGADVSGLDVTMLEELQNLRVLKQ